MADEQLLGDLLVVLAIGKVLQHRQFAVGKGPQQVDILLPASLLGARQVHAAGKQAVARQQRPGRRNQVDALLLLGQVAIRPRLDAATGIERGR
ncbi:hypothetical protein D3C81_1836510 [compost metagenome]